MSDTGDMGSIVESRSNAIARDVFEDVESELSEGDADRIFVGIVEAMNQGVRLGVAEAAAQAAEQGTEVSVEITEQD